MEIKVMIFTAVVLLTVFNGFSFGLMAYDKHCAKRGKWRVSEKALFLSAACFGALGGVLAMHLMRHKTKHWYFRVFFPIMLVVQAAMLGFCVYEFLF